METPLSQEKNKKNKKVLLEVIHSLRLDATAVHNQIKEDCDMTESWTALAEV